MPIVQEHLIGCKTGKGKKQLLIAIGGMHGNEIAGIQAIERVLDVLKNSSKPFNGTFVGLIGNVQAIKAGKRYLHSDLNRIWDEANVLLAQSATDFSKIPDHLMLKQLHLTIEHFTTQGFDEICIIDLHTTSANGGVFIVCPDEEQHKKMISRLHVPVILNLEQKLKGTAMQYFWQQQMVSFAFEGGNHYSPQSVDKMESALWLCLEYMGCVKRKDFDNIEYHDLRLIHATEELPHFCKVVEHHYIAPGDAFAMEPGFTNFQPVARGTLLAHDKNGPIRSSYDGFVLMPLYQSQGSDGYFLIKQLTQRAPLA
ncbi:hypothetical protein GC194_01240 [bacterium]|nr:hypothetical protein [bacterium]